MKIHLSTRFKQVSLITTLLGCGCLFAFSNMSHPIAEESAIQTGELIEVKITKHEFVPDTIVVPVGGSITWTNEDIATHTVTSTTDIFDSKKIVVKSAWTHQFTDTGYFKYYCRNHTHMTGLVIVKSK